MIVRCDVDDCTNNKNGFCNVDIIFVSDKELTAAGFIPLCTDYEERNEHNGED